MRSSLATVCLLFVLGVSLGGPALGYRAAGLMSQAGSPVRQWWQRQGKRRAIRF